MIYQLTKEEEGLLQLLKVAIGESKRSALPKDIDWHKLFDLSERHGVNAIAIDGLGKCGMDSLWVKDASQELSSHKLQWIGMALRVEHDYERKLVDVEKLINLWKCYGIRTIALKGFVTCQYYPVPKHRPFSDFDCFLCGDFERGNEIIRQKGIEVKGSYKHKTFDFGCLHVENHQYCTHFRGRDKARSFEKLLESYMLLEQPVYIEATEIEIPSPLFNALFMVWHTRSHFFDEKVSLRQLLDWALLMKFYKQDGLDWSEFQSVCKEYGLLNFAQAMTRVACKYLGVESNFICEANDEDDDALIRDIFFNEHIHVQYGTGMKARMQVLRNKLKCNWKYRRFSDQSIWGSFWQQIKGAIMEKKPKID